MNFRYFPLLIFTALVIAIGSMSPWPTSALQVAPTPSQEFSPCQVTASALNVRASAAANARIMGSLPRGSIVYPYAESLDHSWWQIGALAWVSQAWVSCDVFLVLGSPAWTPQPTRLTATPTRTSVALATSTPIPSSTPTSTVTASQTASSTPTQLPSITPSPTLTPTPAPEVTARPIYCTVEAAILNVRSDFGTDKPIIGILRRDEIAVRAQEPQDIDRITQVANGYFWMYVRRGNLEGWVAEGAGRIRCRL